MEAGVKVSPKEEWTGRTESTAVGAASDGKVVKVEVGSTESGADVQGDSVNKSAPARNIASRSSSSIDSHGKFLCSRSRLIVSVA